MHTFPSDIFQTVLRRRSFCGLLRQTEKFAVELKQGKCVYSAAEMEF
jgi:hypothetical protein